MGRGAARLPGETIRIPTDDTVTSRRYALAMGVIDNTILPTAADIEAAAKRLAGVAVRTPLINASVLDDAIGARVFLKAETLQRTGSFKFRGAYNKIASASFTVAAACTRPSKERRKCRTSGR